MSVSPKDKTVTADLKAVVSTEKREVMSDVTLQSSDGKGVLALRSILAARSDVFYRMLFGKFAESNESTIRLDYTSTTLEALVHFSLTDELVVAEDGLSKEDEAREMVRIVAAAHFFEFPGLQSLAYARGRSLMANCPSLACPILDEVSVQGAATESMGYLAKQIIDVRTHTALFTSDRSIGGAASISPSTLREVFSRSETQHDALTCFLSIKTWLEANEDPVFGGGYASDYYDCASENGDDSRDRSENDGPHPRQIAKALVDELVDLASISPKDLSDVVEVSGLVSDRRLLQAFKSHAIEAQTKGLITRVSPPQIKDVDQVIVTGAGVPEVNGVYDQDTRRTIKGAAVFRKEGMWEGKETTFLIAQNQNEICERKKWWILTSRKTFFYCSALFENDPDALPFDTWEVIDGKSRCIKGFELMSQLPSPICVVVPAEK